MIDWDAFVDAAEARLRTMDDAIERKDWSALAGLDWEPPVAAGAALPTDEQRRRLVRHLHRLEERQIIVGSRIGEIRQELDADVVRRRAARAYHRSGSSRNES